MEAVDGFHVVEPERETDVGYILPDPKDVPPTMPRSLAHSANDHGGLIYVGFSTTAPHMHLWRCSVDNCPVTMILPCAAKMGRHSCSYCDG